MKPSCSKLQVRIACLWDFRSAEVALAVLTCLAELAEPGKAECSFSADLRAVRFLAAEGASNWKSLNSIVPFVKGCVEVQHMVAALVVSVPTCRNPRSDCRTRCPQRRHGFGLAVEFHQEILADRAAVSVHAVSVEVQGACKQAFMACHNVCEVSQHFAACDLWPRYECELRSPLLRRFAPALRSLRISSCRVSMSA